MEDKNKTKKQLLDELTGLRQRIATLEASQVECKLVSEEPRISTQRWQDTLNVIGDAVCLLDLKGRILQCNTAMANLVKMSFDEIEGRKCWEVMHGTSGPIKDCPIIRMLETNHKESLVLAMGDRWFEVSTEPLLDDNGRPIGAAHIISDVTERRQAEEALRESEERYRLLFDQSPVGVGVASLDGRVIYANALMSEILDTLLKSLTTLTSRILMKPLKIERNYLKHSTAMVR